MVDAVVSVADQTVVVEVQGLNILADIQAQVEAARDEVEADRAEVALAVETIDDAIAEAVGAVAEIIETADTPAGEYTRTAAGQMLDMVRPGEKPKHVQRAEAQARLDKIEDGLPIFANRRVLTAWRAQKRKVQARILAGTGSTVKLKLGIGGDSWADYPTIPQAFADRLYDECDKGGEGLLSVNGSSASATPINGVTMTRSGFTLFDLSADVAPTGLVGLDGHSISATSTASWVINNCVATEFRVYYEKTGAFTWKIDSGSTTTVTTDGSGDLGILTISGLTEAAHSLTIAWSSGTVKILGAYATITSKSGAEVIKFGNAGLTGKNWTLLTETAKDGMTAIADDIGLDAAMLIISTNDYRGVTSLYTDTVQGLRDIASCLSVPPIIVAPARSNGSPIYQPQDIFRDAFWALSQEEDWPFYNMHDDWPTYAIANAEGRWTDSLHTNSAGAADFVNAVGPNLLDLVP